MKIIITGDLAGGASCAARLRREEVPEALNIPLGQLRARLNELPRDREIPVVCRSGQRAYTATRILVQHGFKARDVSGGMRSLAHNYLLNGERSRPGSRR